MKQKKHQVLSFDTTSKDCEYFLKNISEFFKTSTQNIHKARNHIKIIKYKNKELVVKSFKIPHILNKIVYTFFRPSKAHKSYTNSIRVGQFAPKAVGFVEFKKFGLLHSSFFVADNFKYNFTIRQPLTNISFPNKNEVFKSYAKFVFQLHENNILHLDLSPGNVLVKQTQDGYEFKIVDINRMKFQKLSADKRLKNFEKLWAKDEDMTVIAKEYAKISSLDEQYCIEKAIYYSQKNKNFKNFKKRLKGIEVVD
jgi:tRNA A-37 threonylcarbamoyl transferase component Bud32